MVFIGLGVLLMIVMLIAWFNGLNSNMTNRNAEPQKLVKTNYIAVSPPLPAPAKVTPAIQTQEETQFNNDKRSAESGNANAQFYMGLAYSTQTTNFVVGGKDDAESVKWLNRAAEQGMVIAQVEIGRAYYSGRGVNVDKLQAVNWFRKAAEQGSVQGELCLGLCNKYGEGVPINANEAVKWLNQAANHSDATAQFELGCCYSEYGGIDYVKKNNVLAYKWLSLAKAQGKQGTIDGKIGMDALEYVTFYLSPEQKAEAQKLAADFVPENVNRK
jgi:TPR repeat protein